MKETGLMFKGPLVRAILEGSKTQTRRIVSWKGLQQGLNLGFSGLRAVKAGDDWVLESNTRTSSEWRCTPTSCPFGQPGDRIYVRETWMDMSGTGVEHRPDPRGPLQRFAYAAETPPGSYGDAARKDYGLKWKPSIHMPKEVARIWLEITGVRVERLQQITEADCIAEGAPGGHGAIGGYHYNTTPLEQFRNLWESTGGDWDANPWVWVIDFKTISTTGRPV